MYEIAINNLICINYGIKLIPSWIPRKENLLPILYLSLTIQIIRSIDNETFENIQNTFGCFTIDRFSDDIKVFNSKFHCTNTVGVNAFMPDWKNEFNWLSPPVKLVGQVKPNTAEQKEFYSSPCGNHRTFGH